MGEAGVSLAYADLIVLFSAVPEAISFHHKRQWILGQVGCSLLVFGNFLGINAGSLSILAFTIERYIAVMRPMLAQKVCTVGRAKKVITVVWIISIIYCAPWLGLTEVKQDVVDPTVLMCDFRISGDQYIYFFMTDLVLFYFVPLLISAAVYTLIACKVKQRDNNVNGQKPKAAGSRGSTDHVTIDHTSYGSYAGGSTVGAGGSQHSRYPMAVSSIRSSTRSKRGRTQAMPMLVVVVVLFAVCWLPFRGLLVYNSIASEPWLDLWYLLFAKTLIYLNSAINPFLYNFMSRRFSDAVFRFLGIKRERSKPIDL
ncbi:putative Thyrotropin-releasing hormone receptor [Hypsibius exemplaris]|uniref:Thyrotropin-releasing hormone receptor n=1 Tax=Hypsibius exemplaris TaxID=2072580 RepID=A0A9X6NPR1_HYPEX|nr:putative Thyrotropin-releasing hormone receptor [Hypsibius exemplaris]